jgi:hypothetical protein
MAEAGTLKRRWQLAARVSLVRRADGDQSLVLGSCRDKSIQISIKLIDSRQLPGQLGLQDRMHVLAGAYFDIRVTAVLSVTLKRDNRFNCIDAPAEGFLQHEFSVVRTLVERPTERVARAIFITASKPEYVGDFHSM